MKEEENYFKKTKVDSLIRLWDYYYQAYRNKIDLKKILWMIYTNKLDN